MGVVTLEGEILVRDDVLTPNHLDGETIMQAITAALDRIVPQARHSELELRGIGVSVCGYMEPSGDAPDYINLHPLDHYPIRPSLPSAVFRRALRQSSIHPIRRSSCRYLELPRVHNAA